MASSVERRWTVVGICLNKVLTPSLRSFLATVLQNWHHRLCQPPDEIDKQDFTKYKRKLPHSKFQLKYANINNNKVHKSSSAYDYAVKDPLSLAKLYMQPFMAKCTGFDQTMDLSAILTVMCEADPFVTSGAAADAKTVRSDVRNKWAHCNFSEWNEPTFVHVFKAMENLAKKINLSPGDEKTLCDDLEGWKKAGFELCFGQPVNSDLLKLVTGEVAELRTSVRMWTFENDIQMNTMLAKLDNVESNLVCRIEKLEKCAAESSKELKRQSEEIEHIKQKENYSDFADKKGHTSSPFDCNDQYFYYWPRKKLDENIQKIRKGKMKVLYGTIGTGKTAAALHYIEENKEKFDIRWRIDVSEGEESITQSLKDEARNRGVSSYDELFQTIKERARKDIFLLDNVPNVKALKDSKWFQKLWNIQKSVYIIITTTNSGPWKHEFEGAEDYEVGKFDNALDFLKYPKEISDTSEDLKDLCDKFDSNILGLTVARHYMMTEKSTARKYLENLRKDETARKYEGGSDKHATLYHSIRLCLLVVPDENFGAIAATCFISNNKIPEFLLSNLLSSNEDDNDSKKAQRLKKIHDQLKSLVQMTVEPEYDIPLYTYHPFTQDVIRDMIAEKKILRKDLLYNLARTFVRYISKDNRFSKGHFLQRVVREHVKIFIQKCEKEQKDDRTSIALARLSELVGFTYTQQTLSSDVNVDRYFERARDLLHNLCEITEEDIHNSIITNEDREMFGITEDDRKMFGITDKHLAVAHQLFTKLTKKSSELSESTIEELVFSRTVNEQDLAMFPEEVKENETVKEKIKSSEPLSRSDVEMLVNHKAAYSVKDYHEFFLPELYLSVIYSFGRNCLYRDRVPIKHEIAAYIDLLQRAYCLSRAISKKMKEGEAVFHEHSVQSNGLLCLPVNDISKDGTDKKERQSDLQNAIERYRELIGDDRRFFEMGMLKKTKEDTYSKLICRLHIVKCYKTLLSLTADEAHEQCITDGVKACEDLYSALKSDADQTEHLVRYPKYMNAIAEFYLSTNQEEYIPKAIEIFELSVKQAKKYDDDDVTTMFYLEALVGLADCFSRTGDYKCSMDYLERCDSKEFELQRQNNHKKIIEIRKHVRSRLDDEATTSRNYDDTDPGQVDRSSSDSSRNVSHDNISQDNLPPCDEKSTKNSSEVRNDGPTERGAEKSPGEENPFEPVPKRERYEERNGTFQQSSSPLLPGNSSQDSRQDSHQDRIMNADTVDHKAEDDAMDKHQ